MNEMPGRLLAADEPEPVTVRNADGPSPFLIVADHAGNLMPRALGRLGVARSEFERHIAWDIGIAAVGRLVADALGATRPLPCLTKELCHRGGGIRLIAGERGGEHRDDQIRAAVFVSPRWWRRQRPSGSSVCTMRST